MEQLERFLLIASGDDLAGTLSNPGAQVRLRMQLEFLSIQALHLGACQQCVPCFRSSSNRVVRSVVAESLASDGGVLCWWALTLCWVVRFGPPASAGA